MSGEVLENIELSTPSGRVPRQGRTRKKVRSRSNAAVRPGMPGGHYRPLSEQDMRRIHETSLRVLENIGMAEPIPEFLDLALAKGCRLSDQGRLCFPKGLVEDIIDGAAKQFTICGRSEEHDIDLGGERVYFATCGEAVRVPDFNTGEFLPSQLNDVYDFARLVDRLEHIHLFAQTVIATELSEDPRRHDINVAYALLSGTKKHCSIAVTDVSNLADVFEIAHLFAGGEKAFRQRPFLSVGQCPVVSPLKYGEENSQILVEAVKYGSPVEFAVVPQSGATGPAALAGNLVVSTAETLAALLLVNLVAPGHPAIVGNWPFVSDLRTGAFSGGSGEEAVMSAAAAQLLNFYGLPSHTAAGMSDAKVPDAQSGYEKAITNCVAALAGGNLISESAGMLASLMACSYEAMVLDNDILGCVQRVLRGIEVNDQTLSYDVIEEAVFGPGHFLGTEQTLRLMESEYLYPKIADRAPINDWVDDGAQDMRTRARSQALEILRSHFPEYSGNDVDNAIRERFPIDLSRDAMRPETSRWAG